MFDSALCDMKNYAGLERWSGRGGGGWGGEGKGVRVRKPNPITAE